MSMVSEAKSLSAVGKTSNGDDFDFDSEYDNLKDQVVSRSYSEIDCGMGLSLIKSSCDGEGEPASCDPVRDSISLIFRELEDLRARLDDSERREKARAEEAVTLKATVAQLEGENRSLRETIFDLVEARERHSVALLKLGKDSRKVKKHLKDLNSPLPKSDSVNADRIKVLEEHMASEMNFTAFSKIKFHFADATGTPLNNRACAAIKEAFRGAPEKYLIIDRFTNSEAVKLTESYLSVVRERMGIKTPEEIAEEIAEERRKNKPIELKNWKEVQTWEEAMRTLRSQANDPSIEDILHGGRVYPGYATKFNMSSEEIRSDLKRRGWVLNGDWWYSWDNEVRSHEFHGRTIDDTYIGESESYYGKFKMSPEEIRSDLKRRRWVLKEGSWHPPENA